MNEIDNNLNNQDLNNDKDNEELEFKIFIGGYGSDDGDDAPGAKTTLVSGSLEKWTQEQVEKHKRNGNGFGFGFEPITTAKISMYDTTGSENIELPLPAGLIGLYGPSGTGKTHLLQYIMSKINNPLFIRFNEPELPITHFTPNETIKCFEEFLESDQKFCGIDSGRFWVYNSLGKSAAGKGGISTGLYSDLTQLSNALAMKGKTMIMIINPMSPDADSRAAVLNALDGSLAGVIEAISYGKFSYKARTTENMRNNKTYTVDFEKGRSSSQEGLKITDKKRRVKVLNELERDINSEGNVNIEKTKVDPSYQVFAKLFKTENKEK